MTSLLILEVTVLERHLAIRRDYLLKPIAGVASITSISQSLRLRHVSFYLSNDVLFVGGLDLIKLLYATKLKL